jgi:serine/threonine-protein kinase
VTTLEGRTLGNYRILRQIGQGGMARVFRAVDERTRQTVAIKVLAPSLAHDPGFRARFAREVEVLRRLQHPNIVPVLDHGTSHGQAYIVVPFIATGTLHERLRKGPLDPRRVGRIVDQVAAALQFAHENGVVHRDVKPSNVLVDRHGNALLSDFSLARPEDVSQSLTGSSLLGTPAYMSPEQCRGDPADARSDQYSFAVMLFQMVTGELPFEGETPMALAMKHVSTPLPFPRDVNPTLPRGVELVLIKALAKDPALRFASVRDLNRAFQLALRGVLDPPSKASEAPTLDLDRTLFYQRYQNAPVRVRPRRFDRSAILVAALLLLTCTIGAGAVAMIYPEVFWEANAAPPSVAPVVDIQATVDVVLTANAAALGPSVPASVLQTRVYAAVVQTLEATLTPPAAQSLPAVALEDATLPATLVFPTSRPTATRTRTGTATRTPRASPSSPGPSPTGAVASATSTSAVASPTDALPSETSPAATATSPPPTDTPAPPSATASNVPPTNTTAPTHTAPAMVCEWHQGGASVSGDTVSVRVYNDGDLVVRVSQVSITWTGSDHLRRIRWRNSNSFWSGNDDGPTVTAGTNKNVPEGSYRTVEFEFWGSDFDGSASVEIEGDC